MNTSRNTEKNLLRQVAWTHCERGPLDLRPTKTNHPAGYLDATIDFEAQSCIPSPMRFVPVPSRVPGYFASWSPGYVDEDAKEDASERADLIVFTLDGVSANRAHRWLSAHNLAGMVWPATAATTNQPSCCIALLLERSVNAETYKLLWIRLAHEVFFDRAGQLQFDFRHRFHYPRAADNGDSQLLRHNGDSIPVVYAPFPIPVHRQFAVRRADMCISLIQP